ncbi:helix-turn-helix transcriptional regulator [Actinoplanes sp. NPDC023714]|uniref:helix-turn-helix domain-containing protein n=1 Tax=Actinoplanes sp. NPDC023714 TaxID=3154322 RepID=UPI0033F1AF7C
MVTGNANDVIPAGETFGKRLRRLRVARGLRQRDLAGDNISASYISFLEADRREPSSRVVREISERLGCPPEYLLAPEPAAGSAPDRTAAAQLRLARAALLIGELDDAVGRYQQALDDNPGKEDVLEEVEFGLARIAELQGRYADAVVAYEGCLRSAENYPQYTHWLGATLGLIRSLARAGDGDRALAEAERTQERIDALGLAVSDVTVELSSVVAAVWCERGDHEAAGVPIAKAMGVLPQLSERRQLVAVYWNASRLAQQDGRIGHALELAARVTDADTNDYRQTFGMLRAVYGGLLIRQTPARPEQARELLEQAIADLDSAGAVADAARCRNDLIRCLIMQDEAQAAHRMAGEMAADARVPDLERIRCRLLDTTALSLLGDQDGARRACLDAQAELDALPDTAQSSRLWSQLGQVMTEIGETEAAIAAYRRAIQGLGMELPPTLLPTRPQPAKARAAERPARSGNRHGSRT